MPAIGAALGPLALSIAGWSTAALGITGTTAFYAIGIAAQLGIAGGLHALAGALAPKPKGYSPVPQPLQLGIASGTPREWIYGKAAVVGEIHNWFLTGTNNSDLWLVVVLQDTPAQSIESTICENTAITFSSNAATNKYIDGATPLMFRYDKLGSESQTVETNLDGVSADWTSNHRLRGVTYSVFKLIWQADIYTGGLPSPITVMKGRKIWDPRLDNSYGGSGSHTLGTESTYEWSANPALCLLDYLMGVNLNSKRIGGCGIPIGAIDHLSFAAAATICDENVSLAAGGTEDRYTCHGRVNALEDKETVVESLLLSMCGTLVMKGGKIALIAGAAQTAVMSLDDDDLAGPLTINPSMSRQEKFNKVTCVFADPSQNYAVVAGPPLTVSQYITDDGGITLEREIQHRFTTSTTTINRLNKLILSNAREQLSIDAVFKPLALEISAGDTFNWSSSVAGYSTTKMICLQREVIASGELAGCVHIVARQETDAKYSWSTSEEQTPPSFGTPTVPTDHVTLDTPQITASAVTGQNSATTAGPTNINDGSGEVTLASVTFTGTDNRDVLIDVDDNMLLDWSAGAGPLGSFFLRVYRDSTLLREWQVIGVTPVQKKLGALNGESKTFWATNDTSSHTWYLKAELDTGSGSDVIQAENSKIQATEWKR